MSGWQVYLLSCSGQQHNYFLSRIISTSERTNFSSRICWISFSDTIVDFLPAKICCLSTLITTLQKCWQSYSKHLVFYNLFRMPPQISAQDLSYHSKVNLDFPIMKCCQLSLGRDFVNRWQTLLLLFGNLPMSKNISCSSSLLFFVFVDYQKKISFNLNFVFPCICTCVIEYFFL